MLLSITFELRIATLNPLSILTLGYLIASNPDCLAQSAIKGNAVYALHMTKMPGNLQTTIAKPQMRTIYLKLPLKQPRFHWTFKSRHDFLSGKLVLRIKRGDEITEIDIFNGDPLLMMGTIKTANTFSSE
jgi:hypothetical protein